MTPLVPPFRVRCIASKPFMRQMEDGSYEVAVRNDGEVDKDLVVGAVYRVFDIWEGLYEVDTGPVTDPELLVVLGEDAERCRNGLYPEEFFEVLGPIEGWPVQGGGK